jgi:hypothetical protein
MSQTVYTLLCERDMQMAKITLPRIVFFCKKNQKIRVIDDGTLSEYSIGWLESLSGNIKVITKSIRDEQVLDSISRFPGCIKFRNEYPPSFKLIDIPILAKSECSRFTYSDSDIIYIRNSSKYFELQNDTFLRTDAIKLSVKLSTAFFKYKWKIPYKFNSGFFCYDSDNFDFDIIEYFVSRPDVRNMPWVIEQTAWALLFGKTSSLCPLEKQFVCSESFEGPTEKTFAIHLIGKLKNRYVEWSNYKLEESILIPDFEQARNINFLDWSKKSFNRFIK